jgi:hypothetical protein
LRETQALTETFLIKDLAGEKKAASAMPAASFLLF